jgi:hypothetical protein
MKSSRKNDLHRGWMHAPAYWLRQQVDRGVARDVEWKAPCDVSPQGASVTEQPPKKGVNVFLLECPT